MPFKNGPNNSLRYYSSATGRYCNNPNSFQIQRNDNQKLSPIEKEFLKRQELYNHAAKTKDKYVYDLFLFLEKISPGCVIMVNDSIYSKKNKKYVKLIS